MRMLSRWQFATVILAVALLALVMGCGKREEPTGYGAETMTAERDTTRAPYTVGMRGDTFAPGSLVAPPGTTVTFLNDCKDVHTVTLDTAEPAGGPNSDVDYPNGMKTGEKYQWTIPEDAAVGTTWYYHCRFHGRPGVGTTVGTGMAGAVTVGAASVGPATATAPDTTTTPAPRGTTTPAPGGAGNPVTPARERSSGATGY